MEREREFYERLARRGITRRDFMKYCTLLTATLGLSSSFVPRVAEVFAAPKQRPPLVWLHFGECTGCSEATLRTQYPYPDDLVLEILALSEFGEKDLEIFLEEVEEIVLNRDEEGESLLEG